MFDTNIKIKKNNYQFFIDKKISFSIIYFNFYKFRLGDE